MSKDSVSLIVMLVAVFVLLGGHTVVSGSSITGAAIAVKENATVVGVSIFLLLLLLFILFLVIFLIKRKKSRQLAPVLYNPAEDPDVEPPKKWKGKEEFPLDKEMDYVNQQLNRLQNGEENYPIVHKTKAPDNPRMKEMILDDELRDVNTQIHGYKKPIIVLDAPAEKEILDDELENVEKELLNL